MKKKPPNSKRPPRKELVDNKASMADLRVSGELPEQFKKVYDGVLINGEWYLAFTSSQVKIFEDFAKFGKIEIPRLRLTLKTDVVLDIYGSHLNHPDDLNLTHIVHNSTVYKPILEEDYGYYPPRWATMLVESEPRSWAVVYDKAMVIKGEPAKTIFQGVSDSPDLRMLLGVVDDIISSTEDYETKLPTPLDTFVGEPPERQRVGEALLNFIVPAIRAKDTNKLRLLEKCVRFYDPPSKTKIERFAKPLKKLCQAIGRPPSAPELYSAIIADGYDMKESRFYADLNDVGLGWLTRKRSSKTLFGPSTK
jgi:hypothetical protein